MKNKKALIGLFLLSFASSSLSAWGHHEYDAIYGKTPLHPTVGWPARYNLGERPPNAPDREGIHYDLWKNRSRVKRPCSNLGVCEFTARTLATQRNFAALAVVACN